MIDIKQSTTYSKAYIEKQVDALGSSLLVLNTSMIDDDIHKLRKMYDDAISHIDKVNIHKIIKYLEKIKKRILPSNNSVRMSWGIQDRAIVSSGISIKQFKRYRIQAVDYIIQEAGSCMVTVDYSDVLDAIALEMVHKDIGLDTAGIEEKLKEVNIFSVNDIQVLKDLDIFESGLFEDSKAMRVDDTSYTNDGELLSYFKVPVGKVEELSTYRKAMEETARAVTNIILKSVLENVDKATSNFRLIGVYENGFSFSINDSSLLDKMIDNVAVRIFGRTFEVKLKLNSYTKEA